MFWHVNGLAFPLPHKMSIECRRRLLEFALKPPVALSLPSWFGRGEPGVSATPVPAHP